jgi:putative ABC transport system ATP-binding protein
MSTILQAQGISKTYRTGQVKVEALKKCDISIEKGSFTAIVGKSGSGKSTLLRILGTMDEPDKGRVIIDGHEIQGLGDREKSVIRRRNVGFIFQNYSLVPEYTTYENIVLPMILDGRKPSREKANALMKLLEITHCANKLPSQMSGGEQQRAAIARALIHAPSVVFADEPTGNLDAGSAKAVAEMLSITSKKYQQTIVMVTHDRQMAEYADRILTIVDGEVQGGDGE